MKEINHMADNHIEGESYAVLQSFVILTSWKLRFRQSQHNWQVHQYKKLEEEEGVRKSDFFPLTPMDIDLPDPYI